MIDGVIEADFRLVAAAAACFVIGLSLYLARRAADQRRITKRS